MFLSGCAPKGTGAMFSYSAPPTNMAHVTHYRLGALSGSYWSYLLYSNGKFVTRIGNGGYYTESLEPGVYEYKILKRAHGHPVLIYNIGEAIDNSFAKIEIAHTITAAAGMEYYIKWEIIWGGIRATKVEKKVALSDLKDLHRFEFEDHKTTAEDAFNTKTAEPKEE